MQWDVDGYSTLEYNRWEILIEKGFEHNDFIAGLNEGSKDGILTLKNESIAVLLKILHCRTLIGAAGDQNLGLDIEISAKKGTIVVLQCLPQADATLWVGIVICDHCVKCLLSSLLNP